MDPTDGQLLVALRRGDRQALSGLVERHQGVLLGHARALLGDGGPYEDAVQEVFLKLLERPPEMPPEVAGDAEAEQAHLRSWLHTVTRNHCMDTMRADSRRRSREELAAAPEVAGEAAAAGSDLVEARDTRAAVERELARLPADQREVLVLRLLGERSYKEIAGITGKKIGTVGWLISEGLKALSQQLAPLVDGARPAAIAVTAQTGMDGRGGAGGRS
jgi:RNA polymerase sigma-70 factor (ECF subfamily)